MHFAAKSLRCLFAMLLLLSIGSVLFAQQITGAIWTTDSQGNAVNQNIYASKEDVYLNGGPAKPGAAGLPPSPPNYYVQVTDPSGQTVLGRSDGAVIVVDQNGEFSLVQLWSILYQTDAQGNFVLVGGNKVQGYADTPNAGDEYKVWISQDADFKASLSKTDNFKVRVPSEYGQISGYKFLDVNQNGTWDPNEPGLPDWTIVLTDSQGNQVTTTTGADGSYAFNDLAGGEYTISEVLKTGWTQTVPGGDGTYDVTISSGVVITDKDFGNYQPEFVPGEICGYKFKDCNKNGKWDTGEPGLPGWTIVLTDAEGNERTEITDANGYYCFDEVAAGTYTLSEVKQTGWWQSAPGGDGTYTVIINTSDQQVDDQNFGNFPYKPGRICGYKYEDYDGDGCRDTNEPRLPGWTIVLTDAQGNQFTTVTNASGLYEFPGLEPGTYTVSEVQQTGWAQTQPGGAGIYTLAVGPSQSISNTNFGNKRTTPCLICGTKFYDADTDGEWDPGERPLPGWIIKLYNQRGKLVAQTTTNSDGEYQFEITIPGYYIVKECLPNQCWRQILPGRPGGFAYKVCIKGGEKVDGLDFGNIMFCPMDAKPALFWASNAGKSLIDDNDLQGLRDLPLYNVDGSNFDPQTFDDLKAWLLTCSWTNAANPLSVQFAVMLLNVSITDPKTGAPFVDLGTYIYAPDTQAANAAGFATVEDILDEAYSLLLSDNLVAPGDPLYDEMRAVALALYNANANRTLVCPDVTIR